MLGDPPRPSKVVHQVAGADTHTAAVDEVLNIAVVCVDPTSAESARVLPALLGDHMLTAGRLGDALVGHVAIRTDERVGLDPRRHFAFDGRPAHIGKLRLTDAARAIQSRQDGHLLIAKATLVGAATTARAAILRTLAALPAARALERGAEELFVGLDHARQLLRRIGDERRQEAVPPAVERGQAQRDAVVLLKLTQRDMAVHQAKILRPKMTIAKAVKRRSRRGAEGGLTVAALEPLGAALGAAPLDKTLESAMDTGRVENGLAALGECDLSGLILNEASNKVADGEHIRSREARNLVFDLLDLAQEAHLSLLSIGVSSHGTLLRQANYY